MNGPARRTLTAGGHGGRSPGSAALARSRTSLAQRVPRLPPTRSMAALSGRMALHVREYTDSRWLFTPPCLSPAGRAAVRDTHMEDPRAATHSVGTPPGHSESGLCSDTGEAPQRRSAYFLRWPMGYRRDRQPAVLMRAGRVWGCAVPSGAAPGGRAPGGQPFRVSSARLGAVGAGSVRPGPVVTGGGWVGGLPFLWLLFPYLVGVPGDECGGARPRADVSNLSSVPAFPGRRGR